MTKIILKKYVKTSPLGKMIIKEQAKICPRCGYTNVGIKVYAESVWDYCQRCNVKIPYWINAKRIRQIKIKKQR